MEEIKLGSRVRIKQILDWTTFTENDKNIILGAEGVLVSIDMEYEFPYGIDFDNDSIIADNFLVDEVELIEECQE